MAEQVLERKTKRKYNKSYRGQDIGESRDSRHPEETRYIEEEENNNKFQVFH